MSATSEQLQFMEQISGLDTDLGRHFPNSSKIHVAGSSPGLRVPMREIALAATRVQNGEAPNLPLRVYDTSGTYTDPEVAIDLHRGLPPVTAAWVEARGDTAELPGFTSTYGRSRQTAMHDAHLRFQLARKPRMAPIAEADIPPVNAFGRTIAQTDRDASAASTHHAAADITVPASDPMARKAAAAGDD